MKRATCAVLSISLVATGCATSSADIATAYVSPLQYQSYDCDQIIAETRRLEQRVQELGGRLDEAASNDKAITGVGLILFWPALFALGGTKQQEAEYARLKGEYEALQQAAVQKKCARQSSAGSAPAAPAAGAAPAQTGIAGATASATLDSSIPRIPGNDLRVATRTLSLGDGEWVDLASVESQLLASTQPSSSAGAMYSGNAREVKTLKKTVAEAVGGGLGRVLVVSTNISRQTGLASWNVEPCKAPDTRFNEKLSPSFDLPECLYVRRITSMISAPGDLSTAVAMANASRLSVAPVYFEVGYAKYTDSGYLEVTAFLPSTQVADDGLAMSWGRTLARSMRPLAQGTLTRAMLPPAQF